MCHASYATADLNIQRTAEVNKSEGAGVSWSKYGTAFGWEIAALLSGQNLPKPAIDNKQELVQRWHELFPSAPSAPGCS